MSNRTKQLTILYHHRTRAMDGQSVHIDEMIRALRGLGHRVIVVGPRRVAATTQSIESRLLPPSVYELVELGYSFIELAKLSVAAMMHRPDVLYERENLFMLSGLWTARLFRLPYLLEVNSPLAEERARYSGLFWRKLASWTEHACWRSASVLLPVTDVLADHMRCQGVPDKQIAIAPNGVDPGIFFARDTKAAKRQLGLQDHLVLGFVGYLRDWHGLHRVIEILAKQEAMKKAFFLVVGDGPARAALEKQADELGVKDRVRITGTMPRDTLPELIAAFDIALQPAVTAYASPLKLFEYMAQARTIVAPACRNIMEILVDQEDAFLYPPESESGFSDAIETLAGNPILRERLGRAAAAKIVERDLTWSGNARRVAAIANSLVEQRFASKYDSNGCKR